MNRAVSPWSGIERRLPLLAAIFFVAGLLVLLTLGAGVALGFRSVVWVSGALLVVLFFVLRTFGWRDMVDPIIFYPALLWFVFGVVVLVPSEITTLPVRIEEEELLAAFNIVLLALVCFMGAYGALAKPTPQIRLTATEIQRVRRPRLFLVIGVLFVARIGLISLGNFGYILSQERYEATLGVTGLLGVFADLVPYALTLVALGAFGEGARRSDVAIFVLVALAELGLGFVSGTKGGIAFPVVAMLLGYVYARGRVPWRSLGVLLVIFLFLVPGIERYRELLNSPGERVGNVGQALEFGSEALDEMLAAPNFGQRVEDGYYFLAGRLNELQALAVVYVQTPEPVPYELGRNYWFAPLLNVVPRAIWDTKPVLDIGGQTAFTYYGVTGSSFTRTIIGDFYVNFGIPGVVGGMLLFGVVTALLRRRFVEQPDVRHLLFYGVAFFTLLNHESDFTQILAGLPRLLIVVWFVGWFVTRRPDAENESSLPA